MKQNILLIAALTLITVQVAFSNQPQQTDNVGKQELTVQKLVDVNQAPTEKEASGGSYLRKLNGIFTGVVSIAAAGLTYRVARNGKEVFTGDNPNTALGLQYFALAVVYSYISMKALKSTVKSFN